MKNPVPIITEHEALVFVPLTYEEAKERLDRSEDKGIQAEYNDRRLQEELALAEEDDILVQSHHILSHSSEDSDNFDDDDIYHRL
jgi:hypothetical protein